MYRPPAFAEDDPARLRALIAAHPLGLLISAGPGGLMANPLPFFMRDDRLTAHMARANPQLDELRAAPEVLVNFQIAGAYISPALYAAKAEHGRVVPTWNYAMVQARGTVRLTEDPDFLRDQLTRLSDQQEAPRPAPWAVSDAPEGFIRAQMRAIIGLEITVTALSGKLKLSQNRPAPDRKAVREALPPDLARLMPET